MVTFDFSFRSMLIEDIVEDEGSLWTEGSISWLSINISYYNGKRVQVAGGDFCPCIDVGVLLGAAYFTAGSRSVSSVWLLVWFF